jgi:hypothetical protein
LFDDVSKWAYKAIRQGWPRYNQWYAAVLSRTEMVNAQFKVSMDYNEYKHIAKSIATWTHDHFTPSSFAQWQSNNGKLSGIARANKSKDNRIQAIGMSINGDSAKNIAEVLNVPISTIYRWIK